MTAFTCTTYNEWIKRELLEKIAGRWKKYGAEDCSETAGYDVLKAEEGINARVPWLDRMDALDALRKTLEAQGFRNGQTEKNNPMTDDKCFELCRTLWSEVEHARAVDQEAAGLGLLDALRRACLDLRSQLVKKAVEEIEFLAKNVVIPSWLGAPVEGVSALEEHASCRRVSMRELNAVREFAESMGIRSTEFIQKRRILRSQKCADEGWTRCRSFSEGERPTPVAALFEPDEPKETKWIVSKMQDCENRHAGECIFLYILEECIFPLLIKTKKVFSEVGEVCANRMFACVSERGLSLSSAMPLARFLSEQILGRDVHPLIREHCGTYLLEFVVRPQLNNASLDTRRKEPMHQESSTPYSRELIQCVEKTISGAVADASPGVRQIARQMYYLYAQHHPKNASELLSNMAPEDRKRLQERPSPAHSTNPSRPEPLQSYRFENASRNTLRPSFSQFRQKMRLQRVSRNDAASSKSVATEKENFVAILDVSDFTKRNSNPAGIRNTTP